MLDFSAVTRMDSAGLRAIEELIAAANGKGVRLELRGVNVIVYKGAEAGQTGLKPVFRQLLMPRPTHSFSLNPFEVLVLESTPTNSGIDLPPQSD